MDNMYTANLPPALMAYTPSDCLPGLGTASCQQGKKKNKYSPQSDICEMCGSISAKNKNLKVWFAFCFYKISFEWFLFMRQHIDRPIVQPQLSNRNQASLSSFGFLHMPQALGSMFGERCLFYFILVFQKNKMQKYEEEWIKQCVLTYAAVVIMFG